MPSPYENVDRKSWRAQTEQLISNHPLELNTIRSIAVRSWETLWQTRIGEGEAAFPLADIEDLPATVVGYFFEKLFSRELELEYPGTWRGGQSREEKDLVHLFDSKFSIEMKSSGQLGTKVFGNRSYNQQTTNSNQVAKQEKSGYYITVNFYGRTLTLLRFGWIDQNDWAPQGAQTGQAATLPDYVYDLKLVEIPGSYQFAAPVSLLSGVGPKTAESLASKEVSTIGDLLRYQGTDLSLLKLKEQAAKHTQTTGDDD